MNKRAVIGAICAISTLFALQGSALTFAENTTDFSITVNPSLSLRVSSNNVGFEITPNKDGEYNSTRFNVYSSTNNTTGYTLTMSTSNANLTSSTVNPNTGTNPTIPTLTETNDGISPYDFEHSTSSDILNRYGVAYADPEHIDTTNFNIMKTEQEINKTDENNTTEDTTVIALASKLDLNTVPGVYSTTLNFSIVVNAVDPVQPYPTDPCDTDPNCDSTSGVTLQRAYELAYTAAHKGMWEETTAGSNTFQYIDSWNGAQYQGQGRDVRFLIQDMTPSICNTATVIGSTALVLDVRDQTSYRIVKAADGRCWMQDNLALDVVANKANLSPQNTNATQAAINNYITSSGTAIHSGWATEAVSYETSSSVFEQPRINVDSKLTVPQGSDDPLKDLARTESWKIGVYYNYCAASIGTYCYAFDNDTEKDQNSAIDTDQDICPAGWRMPTGGPLPSDEGQANGGEYQALYDAYPSISGGDTQYTRLRKVLCLPLSGDFINGSEDEQESWGFFWSSTYSRMNSIYILDVENSISEIDPQEDDYRMPGQSVRCINKTGTEPAPSGN